MTSGALFIMTSLYVATSRPDSVICTGQCTLVEVMSGGWLYRSLVKEMAIGDLTGGGRCRRECRIMAGVW